MKKEKLKSAYLDPELEIFTFNSSDVIATSGGDRFDWGSSGGGGNDDEDAWT